MCKFVVKSAAVAACALIFLPLAAAAQTRPSEQAAEMMARAQALDIKCSILDQSARDQLSRFSARAESALANRESAEVTKDVMQRGKAAGEAAACSADEKSSIRMLLSAALQAAGEPPLAEVADATDSTAVAEGTSSNSDSAPPMASAADAAAMSAAIQPRAIPVLTRPLAVKSNYRLTTAVKPVGGLGTYARLTQAYYVARRCGGNQTSAYRAVVAEHDRVMKNHSAAEVAAILRQAEIRAGGSSCS